MNHLADRVRDERLARGWSIRHAVVESGNLITNTWWGKFEDRQQPLTDTIRDAVAAAYKWPKDWPDEVTPPAGMADVGAQRSQFEMAQEVARLADLVRELRASVRDDVATLRETVLEQGHRLAVLEQAGRESG